MESSDIKRLGLILSAQAEIEAMKAQNDIAKQSNECIPFGYSHFIDQSWKLKGLAEMYIK